MTLERPRILFVSPVSDFKGGAEVVLRQMLANPFIEPVLAVPSEGAIADEALSLGIPVDFYRPTAMLHVHRPPRPGPIIAAVADAVRCASRLRRIADRHGCGVIHSNGLKAHMLGAILGRSGRAKTLVHLHDIPYSAPERLIWRAIARRVSRVIMVSRPCYPGATLPANVTVLANGIEMVGETLAPARPEGPLRLGFLGRYTPNKGLDLLLDWFGATQDAGLDATLTIRGRADPDAPEYWEAIKARIGQSAWSDRVTDEGWTTGSARFAALDILLVSSRQPDPAPLVVPEAMSAGVIVAGYPAGGIPGMIEHGKTGLLVSTGAELTARLSQFAQNNGAMEAMRAAAFAKVHHDFTIAGFHGRLRDTYQSLLGPDKGDPQRTR